MQRKTSSLSESVYLVLAVFCLSAPSAGCATAQPQQPAQAGAPHSSPDSREPSKDGASFDGLPPAAQESIREIEKEILEADAELKQPEPQSGAQNLAITEAHPKVPLEINENVRKWIHYFTVKDRERFQRFLERGSVYKDLVKGILRKNGVPTELYYLAMIESGYVTHARSHAKAEGAWQFIRGTADRYGLQRSAWLDERRDIIRSTESAAIYLRNLYTAYQSWYLAIASYNAGEGRILGAVVNGGTRDFWKLVERRALPRETREYVPKFLAASIIGRHPEKYGFALVESKPFPEHEAAEIPGGVRLSEVADKSGISRETLKMMNPHLLKSLTPPNLSSYPVWLPKGSSEKVSAILPGLARLRTQVVRSQSAPKRRVASDASTHHRVRRGENLALIARKYGLSIPELKRINRLNSSRVMIGQRLKVSIPM